MNIMWRQNADKSELGAGRKTKIDTLVKSNVCGRDKRVYCMAVFVLCAHDMRCFSIAAKLSAKQPSNMSTSPLPLSLLY